MRTALGVLAVVFAASCGALAQQPVDMVIATLRNTRPLTPEVVALAEKQLAELKSPAQDRAQYAQALIDRANGERKKAKKTLEVLTRDHPDVAEYQSTFGTLCFEVINDAGTFEKMSISSAGRSAYEKAIKLDPTLVEPRVGLTRFFIMAPSYAGGSYRKAEEQANALIAIPEGKGELSGRLLLTDIYAGQGAWDKMSEQYKLAETAPGSPNNATAAMRGHAQALLNKKKDPAAALLVLEEYQKAAAPDDATPWYLTGEAERMLGNDPAAIRAYARAVEISPIAMNSRFAYAELLEKNKQYSEAAEQYSEFAKRFPDEARASAAIKSAARCTKKSK